MQPDDYVDVDQMRQYLRQAFACNRESSFLFQVSGCLQDPVKPRNAKGRRRIHPMVVMSMVLILVLLVTFVGLGLMRP